MSDKGFTLVELVMTLVLISILAAVAMPRFFSSSSFEQHALFQDTLSAVRYAQKLAVSSGCQTQVRFASNSYTVIRENSCGSGQFTSNLPVLHPVTQSAGYSGSQSGVSITASNSTTTFNALGEADADNTISVGPYQLSIVAATGFSYDSTP